MTGQILNKNQVNKIIEEGRISILPSYDFAKFQIAQYPLTPLTIYEIESNQTINKVFILSTEKSVFVIKPKTYYIIEIEEIIVLPKEIVGRFIPSSNLIEKGIILTTGKLDYPYGRDNERIRFGLFNCLDFEASLEYNNRIAYVQFFNIGDEKTLDYFPTKYEEVIYSKRRAEDDGPNYELDEN